jgi:peroxiredoxin
MDSTNLSSGTTPGGSRTPRLALASLILGILGLAGSVVVFGSILAFVGLALGATHLRRSRQARAMGWAGVSFSLAAMVCSFGFAAFYVRMLPQMVAGIQQGPGSAGYAAWVGKLAPDFEVTKLDGTRLKLSDLRGQRVILDFWATWCGPCVMEIPHFSKLHREHGRDSLTVLGLSREDRVVLKRFVETHDVPYAIASVENVELPEPYGAIRSIPTTFFIDASGTIQEVVVGYHDFEALKRSALGTEHPGTSTPR